MGEEVEAALGARVRETVGIELVALAADIAGRGVNLWRRTVERIPRGRWAEAATTLRAEGNGALPVFKQRRQQEFACGTMSGGIWICDF